MVLNKTESIIYGIGLFLMLITAIGLYATHNDGFILIEIPGSAIVLWVFYSNKRRLKKQKSTQANTTIT